MPMKVLVIAAHPDDEILGCGGTIAKHVQQDDEVHVFIAAEGITSRDQTRSRGAREEELSALSRSAHRANEALGVSSVTLSSFPDNRMDSVDLLEIVKTLEGQIAKIRPQRIYTHHAGDVNIDHHVLHRAVVTACRPVPHHPVETLLFFEVPSSTEWQTPASGISFTPHWFVDISSTLALKLKALEEYRSEMRPWPHARSMQAVESLARWRGASVGAEAAEAFLLGRNKV